MCLICLNTAECALCGTESCRAHQHSYVVSLPGRTILLAQELGAGLGHASRLGLIARSFPDARRVFVLPDPDLARPVLARMLEGEVACLPAPRVRGESLKDAAGERTMADILAHLGFADASALGIAADGWRALLGGVRPDLVISDFAPTLRIAVAGAVPHIAVGNGFVVPPDVAPLPPLDRVETGGLDPPVAEAAVLEAVDAVRRSRGGSPFPRVASLFRGDETFGASLPLLDPYHERRTHPLFRPFGSLGAQVGPPVPERLGPFMFCYLDADAPAVNPVLTALNGLDIPSRIFVRGIDPVELARHCAPQVGIHQGPADLRALLPQVRLVVHGATLGTAETALLSGTPQLLAPDTLERELTARAVAGSGAGLLMRAARDSDPEEIRAVMIGMLSDAGFGERARHVAAHQRGLRLAAPLPAVVAAARALLARAAGRA